MPREQASLTPLTQGGKASGSDAFGRDPNVKLDRMDNGLRERFGGIDRLYGLSLIHI